MEMTKVSHYGSTPLHRPHTTSMPSMPRAGNCEAIKQAAIYHPCTAYSVGNSDRNTTSAEENEENEGKYWCFELKVLKQGRIINYYEQSKTCLLNQTDGKQLTTFCSL